MNVSPCYASAANSTIALFTRAEVLTRIRQAQERRAFLDLKCFRGVVDEVSRNAVHLQTQ